MPLSISWDTKVINVPKSYTTLIQAEPTEIREMDLNQFRLDLKDIEDSEEGMPFLDTHQHNTEVEVGGLTLARVVEIINGYTVTFEDGQYAVNLTGANSNVGDVVNVNQVSVRSFNSAGMTSSPAIEYASFNGGVTIDINSGTSGTVYPIGTPRLPVNNVTDALLIAGYRGFTTFYVNGNITLDSGTDFEEMIFVGESTTKSVITISTDADVENCEFYDAEVTGILDGGNVLKHCLIGDLNYVNGYIEQCILKTGTITLGGSAEAHFLDCWSGVVGSSIPIIDMGGSGQALGMRNYNGGIEIKNKTGNEKISIDLNSGQIILDSTVTNGEVIVRGIGKLIDNSTGLANVVSDDFVNPSAIADAVWDENLSNHSIPGSASMKILQGLGLMQENQYMDNTVYTTYNNQKLLTSARIRTYSTATDVGTATNVIASYLVSASWNNDEMTSYMVTKI